MDISITVTVNGESFTTQSQNILELITEKQCNTSSLVVELNQNIIMEQKWAQTRISSGDTLELLQFVGGG